MWILGGFVYLKQAVSGSFWHLKKSVNAYAREYGAELATEIDARRNLRLINTINFRNINHPQRLKVQLLEDGYFCWIDTFDFIQNLQPISNWEPNLLSIADIKSRLTAVLNWVEDAANTPNNYLWGGTLGPNFDCSGLVQAAFSSQSIWLPRDAYQQEEFCTSVKADQYDYHLLSPGDLLFFGTPILCTHVGIYKGDGKYWHSSGKANGRDGIGCDGLNFDDSNHVASHYRAQYRGAGRVECCKDFRQDFFKETV